MPPWHLWGLILGPVIQGKSGGGGVCPSVGRQSCGGYCTTAPRRGVKTAVWKPYYQALLAREFSATQALVILARKLLRIAFSLWRQADARFDAQKIGCIKVAA